MRGEVEDSKKAPVSAETRSLAADVFAMVTAARVKASSRRNGREAAVLVRAFLNSVNRRVAYRRTCSRRLAGPVFLVNEMLVGGFTGQVILAMLDVAGWARPWNTSDARELDKAMVLVGDEGERR